jgi:beta-lactamase class D
MRVFLIVLLTAVVATGCSLNNVKEDKSLAHFFTDNKVEGSFALLDNGTGQFTLHNLEEFRDSAYLPAQTYNIVHALIGLQTGKIRSDSSLPNLSFVPSAITKDTLQFWLDSLGYGARNDKEKVKITTSVDSFWQDNSFKVSPDAQLGLVKRLYFDQLPFFKTYQEVVKGAMKVEENTKYRLGYQTGVGTSKNGHQIGWVVGWIEENNHPYFFVLNVDAKDPGVDLAVLQVKMLKDILKSQDFFEGNR